MRIALFGHPLGHSRSKDLFDALAAAGGPRVEYEPVDVPPERFGEALARLRDGEWDGANVTVPHKRAAAAAADLLEPFAARCGAANVLARRGGGALVGANTDGLGFLDALSLLDAPASRGLAGGGAANRALAGGTAASRGLAGGTAANRGLAGGTAANRALVLGAGGAAAAVVAALVETGHAVALATRDPQRARRDVPLAAEALAWDDPRLPAVAGAAGLVVQATPLGTAPRVDEAPPFDPAWFAPGARAVDLIYNPWETRWLRLARARGVAALNGWPMLVGQAARSLAFWGLGEAAEALVEASTTVEPRDPLRAS